MRLLSSVNSGLLTVRKHEAPQKMNYFNLILGNMENVVIPLYVLGIFDLFFYVPLVYSNSTALNRRMEGSANDSNLRLLSNLLKYLCKNCQLYCS